MRAARNYLNDLLVEKFPKWRIVASPVNVDALDRVTVFVNVTAIARAPEAPMGSHASTVTLTLVSPKSDFAQAETELEDAIEALTEALEAVPLPWDEATKVTAEERYLAWNIPVTVYTSRKD